LRLALALLLALALPAAAQPLKRWTGGAAPALELRDTQGRLHRLADYRGSAVLVNFWATWCEPCREEMPGMERLRTQMQGKRFVVLAVNVGEGARAARAFGERMGLGFPLLLDSDTKAARAWSARVLPASFVVDPAGDIRYSYFGAIDWARDDVRKAIEALLR
jgi:peroxiredoxin